MAKKKPNPTQKPNAPKQTPAEIAEGIRCELRSIVTQWDDLRQPFNRFIELPDAPDGQPRYILDGARSAEEIQERLLRFAGTVWQLKDRLILWFSARPKIEFWEMDQGKKKFKYATAKDGIEKPAARFLPLMICADLFNQKKHGENKNRSGYSPRLNGVQFDFSGLPKGTWQGFKYDGASKRNEMALSVRHPVPYVVPVVSHDEEYGFGHAVDVIVKAFSHWLPLLLTQIGSDLLPNNPEGRYLVDGLRMMQQAANQPTTLPPARTP